jgi:hypothetical protein
MGKNWQWSYQKGHQARLDAEKAAATGQSTVPAVLPVHSHDATMQARFAEGWHSPTPVEIHRFINPPPSVAEQLRANVRLRDVLKLGAS